MDVLTLNLSMQKLQVNRAAVKDGQLPLPASNNEYISEMTDWISSGGGLYVLSSDDDDDTTEEKPAILADGAQSLSSRLCSANNSSSSSSRSSVHHIPPQSSPASFCLTSSRNSRGTSPPHMPPVFSDFSSLEERRSMGWESPTSSVEEELSGVDWAHQSGRSGTSDDEVCTFMTHARPSASFGVASSEFSRPVEAESRVLEPRNIQGSRAGGFAPTKKKAMHPISVLCDSTAAVIVRPNLDFDKMRKTCYGRRSARNDIKKPKIIRIRSFRESVHCTLQSQFSPSVAAFGLLSRKARFSPVISVESLS